MKHWVKSWKGQARFAFSYDDATAPARVLNDAEKSLQENGVQGQASSKGNTMIKRISKRLQQSHPEIHSSPSSWEAFSPRLANFARVVAQIAEQNRSVKTFLEVFIADCMNRFKPQIVCGQ